MCPSEPIGTIGKTTHHAINSQDSLTRHERRRRIAKLSNQLLEQKVKVEDKQTAKILFIDAYDSFSNSIIALLKQSLTTSTCDVDIKTIKIDHAEFVGRDPGSTLRFRKYLKHFDAVCAGPGPGTPENDSDAGLIDRLWELPEDDLLPVLGICLGFQSMCLAAGACIKRLRKPRHGIIKEVLHSGDSLFQGVENFRATQYHSLHVDICHNLQNDMRLNSSMDLWRPSEYCPKLRPIAWDCNDPENGAILMGVEHTQKPFWAVQYHPESICTDREGGKKIIVNWWNQAKVWIATRHGGSRSQSDTDSRKRKQSPNAANCATEEPSRKLAKVEGAAIDLNDSGATNGQLQIEDTYAPLDVEGREHSVDETSAFGDAQFGSGSILDSPPLDSHQAQGARQSANTDWFGHSESDLDDGYDDPPDTDGRPEDFESSRYLDHVSDRFGGFAFSRRVRWKSRRPTEEALRSRITTYVKEVIDSQCPGATSETALLESGLTTTAQGVAFPLRRDTGRFSILGLMDGDSAVKILYYRKEKRTEVWQGEHLKRREDGVDFARFLADFRGQFSAHTGPADSPFWGGMIMLFDYEAGLDSISVQSEFSNDKESDRPNIIGLVFLRSVVIDHEYHEIWVQSIKPDDNDWVESTDGVIHERLRDLAREEKLEEMKTAMEAHEQDCWREQLLIHRSACRANGYPEAEPAHAEGPDARHTPIIKLTTPSRSDYEQKVCKCQEFIASGDSYELCLTGQSVVSLPSISNRDRLSWKLYRNLMSRNPAPFGAYIRLNHGLEPVTIISSSPERFLSWDRGKKCQFRPIKGTWPKTAGRTLRDAEAFFKSEKERAENLMITDLIRHDLYGVLEHLDCVKVEKLFGVEEYETVFQLVSVIEGRFKDTGKTGLDVLNASVPPGSMTGAPKKRSCELLQQIEAHQPRGLYSGILGYSDVGGGGDFSVVIRSAIRWDGDVVLEDSEDGAIQPWENWRIGAGGAVTAQSTPGGEYDEMCAKRDSVLSMFDGIGQLVKQNQ